MIPDVPEVRCAGTSGDVQIAYEVIGKGDLDIVLALDAERVRMPLLLTDIVEATTRAGEVGDFEWRNRSGRHDGLWKR